MPLHCLNVSFSCQCTLLLLPPLVQKTERTNLIALIPVKTGGTDVPEMSSQNKLNTCRTAKVIVLSRVTTELHLHYVFHFCLSSLHPFILFF